MIKWNPTTPSQWLERSGGVGFSLISLIDQSTTALWLNKNHHTMGKGVRSCSGLTLANNWLAISRHGGNVEGLQMNIYWLGMLKDISLPFSQIMRREKEKKEDAKFVLIKAKARRRVTFVLIVMLGFVPHLVSDCTINNRLCKMSKKHGKSFYCVPDSVLWS